MAFGVWKQGQSSFWDRPSVFSNAALFPVIIVIIIERSKPAVMELFNH
jgi:hypothetical protein